MLAFGETLAAVYRGWGWGDRVFVWHEAADNALFRPPERASARRAVWIGNWGDGERSQELRGFLLDPAQPAGCRSTSTVCAIRLPRSRRSRLRRAVSWLARERAGAGCLRAHLPTLHVPRRFYVTHLPGIPTIRVFEALACGIPLVSAPWRDRELVFTWRGFPPR